MAVTFSVYLFVDHLLELVIIDRLVTMLLQLFAELVAGLLELPLLSIVLLFQLLQFCLKLLLVHCKRLNLPFQDLQN